MELMHRPKGILLGNIVHGSDRGFGDSMNVPYDGSMLLQCSFWKNFVFPN